MPRRVPRTTKAAAAAQTRAELLDAGAQLLLERPTGLALNQVKASEVSRRANRTIGAFYHHWSDQRSYQHDLLRFVLASGRVGSTARTISEVRADIARDVPVEETVRRNARENFEAVRDSPFTPLFITLWAQHDKDEKVRDLVLLRYREATDSILPVYREFFDSQGWELRPPFTFEMLAVTLTALVEGLAVRAAVDPDAVPLEIPSVQSAAEAPSLDDHLDDGNWDLFSIAVLALLPSMAVPKAKPDSGSWPGHEDVRSLVRRLCETWEPETGTNRPEAELGNAGPQLPKNLSAREDDRHARRSARRAVEEGKWQGANARIVCVHGMGKQVLGEQSLLQDWWPALADGLTRADADLVPTGDVAMAFYGDLFRPQDRMLAVGDPPYSASDVEPGLEQELLLTWWRAATALDQGIAGPDDDTEARVPGSVQAALRQLSRSSFFAGVALRALVFDLKQLSRYMQEPGVRRAARARVAALIGPDTQVVVAHSLGSVVAYEALCAMPGHPVRALVTLGSPLGIQNLVFDRLEPAPRGGLGQWPGSDGLIWTNVADSSDVVALEKDLRGRFGDRVCNALVHYGAHAHDATSYLTDKLTGAAIARGLSNGRR